MKRLKILGFLALLIPCLLQANLVFAIGEYGGLAGFWHYHVDTYSGGIPAGGDYCVQIVWNAASTNYSVAGYQNPGGGTLNHAGTYAWADNTVPPNDPLLQGDFPLPYVYEGIDFIYKFAPPYPTFSATQGRFDIMDSDTLYMRCSGESYCYNDYTTFPYLFSYMSRNNPNVDSDGNGLPDVCQNPIINPCTTQGGDTDGDGFCDLYDNCPNDRNPDQTNICSAPGVSVSGIVYYSTTPYGNITLELIPDEGPGSSPIDPADYTTTSDATTGYYEFSDVEAGDYWLAQYGPSGAEWQSWQATPITVAGVNIANFDLYLKKNIILNSPPTGATVSTQNPELCWLRTDLVEVSYSIQINETANWFPTFESQMGITGFCYTVSGTLLDNTEYTWQIGDARDAFGNRVGSTYEAFTFTTQFNCDDTDFDGVCDFEDNCPDYSNRLQADNDYDSYGDVCDNCPFTANGPEDFEDQLNTDEDEMGDICDPCPFNATNDCYQSGVKDGLTAELQTPLPALVVKPGEPIPVELCQQNPDPEDEYTIFDCFTATYQIFASTDLTTPLRTMHKDRVAYIVGIPGSDDFPATQAEMGDVVIIPAGGELCITCDIEERVKFPIPAPGDSATFTGDVCSTNYITDRNRVNGGCIASVDPDDGCFDMKIGTVCAPLAKIKVSNRDTVEIDIKPGTEPNNINLGSNGKVPVAILSSSLFDATTIDPTTVLLGGAEVAFKGKSDRPMTSVEDVNGDGLPDLIIHIETEGFELTDGDVTAELEAEAKAQNGDVIFIRGEDSVRVVPAK